MRLLIVGTLEGQLTSASKIAMDKGASVTHADSNEQALAVLRSGRGADLLMVDVTLDIRDLVKRLDAERIHVPVVACGITNDARAAVNAIHAGAKEYIPLPPDPDLIAAVLAAVTDDAREMIYRDEAMASVVKLAQQIAGSDASVLITGESGTGKEVLARYLHARSLRAKKPFITVNCAAIPENLLESELFGHEKGAFTGALGRRIGKFEEANGGTLLLDEISEMDVRLQAKLLRAIQERLIDRVGGGKPVPVDIRIVATSNRNLTDAVREGKFREDLLVPPQRGQPENPAVARAPVRHHRAGAIFRQEIFRGQRPAGTAALGGSAPRAQRQPLAGQCARTGKHPASRGAALERAEIGIDGILSPDGTRLDPARGSRRGRPCGHGRRAGHTQPGWPHRGRGRTRPDPGNAQALPRQPHPCGQYPRHLDPHPAQQAQRIRRRRRADPASGRRRAARRGLEAQAIIKIEKPGSTAGLFASCQSKQSG